MHRNFNIHVHFQYFFLYTCITKKIHSFKAGTYTRLVEQYVYIVGKQHSTSFTSDLGNHVVSIHFIIILKVAV